MEADADADDGSDELKEFRSIIERAEILPKAKIDRKKKIQLNEPNGQKLCRKYTPKKNCSKLREFPPVVIFTSVFGHLRFLPQSVIGLT